MLLLLYCTLRLESTEWLVFECVVGLPFEVDVRVSHLSTPPPTDGVSAVAPLDDHVPAFVGGGGTRHEVACVLRMLTVAHSLPSSGAEPSCQLHNYNYLICQSESGDCSIHLNREMHGVKSSYWGKVVLLPIIVVLWLASFPGKCLPSICVVALLLDPIFLLIREQDDSIGPDVLRVVNYPDVRRAL